MTDPTHPTAKLDFFGLDAAAFDAAVVAWGWPRFRAQQVRDWVYGRGVADPGRMTNLSKRDRELLADRLRFASADITREQRSSDGTRKLLLTWPAQGAEPGAAPGSPSAETVMIPDADRRTACVSSQVGCPVGCTFCASGINGVKGNLTAAQIVEQVYQLGREESDGATERRNDKGTADDASLPPPSSLRRSFAPSLPHRITNVVFMGMGEPMANYANVMQAVRVLHDPKCFNIGARRITISTVGVPPKMRQLAGEALPLNLAISLHAPNEPLRKQLIPWAEHFALDEILDAARYYFDQTGREITLEYILLAGVNDRPEHARELARLCKTLRANVNLIRYNEVESLPYLRPKADDVVRFQEILRKAGVNAHVRKSRGRDIDAACGQLRRKEQAQREREQLVTLGDGT
jgi:23S rRNA (adenine2503-C2)-methyltransferase